MQYYEAIKVLNEAAEQELQGEKAEAAKQITKWWKNLDEGAEYRFPKYCSKCGSENLRIRAVFTAGQVRALCGDCGFSEAVKKVSNEGKRDEKQHGVWAAVIKDKAHNRCEICGSKENIEAHHIIPVSHNVERAWDLRNGIALCKKRHYQVHHRTTGEYDDN